MIVDDEYLIKKSLKKVIELNSRFHVTYQADNGKEALDMIRGTVPDVIITDVCMPVMDGIELIQQIHSSHLSTKLVILSGHADFQYAQQAIRYGAMDYLLKPIQLCQVEQMLDKIEKQLIETSALPSVDRNSWLKQCTVDARAISELIWITDEAGLQEKLQAIFNQYNQLSTGSGDALSVMLGDLLAFIEAEISERSQSRTVTSFHLEFNREKQPEQPETLFSCCINRIVERIRSVRQWGHYHAVNQAIAFLTDHYMEESLTLQEVAAKTGISTTYLSRLFKEAMGISFIDYLTSLRMEKAKQLLADPKVKSYEVAHFVGFADYPHFARTFKKRYGLSATEYRGKIR